MSKKLLLLSILILLIGSLAAAKDRYKVKDNKYVVEGDDLPKYVLVDVFFGNASERYNLGSPLYHSFLLELGIKPDSAADAALFAAILQWRKAMADALDMRPFANVDEATWNGLQDTGLRKNVIELKKIYNTLRDKIEKSGESFQGIERFLNERLKKNTNITYSAQPNKSLEIMDLFEKDENSKDN